MKTTEQISAVLINRLYFPNILLFQYLFTKNIYVPDSLIFKAIAVAAPLFSGEGSVWSVDKRNLCISLYLPSLSGVMYLELWILACFILTLIFEQEESTDPFLLFHQTLGIGAFKELKAFLIWMHIHRTCLHTFWNHLQAGSCHSFFHHILTITFLSQSQLFHASPFSIILDELLLLSRVWLYGAGPHYPQEEILL